MSLSAISLPTEYVVEVEADGGMEVLIFDISKKLACLANPQNGPTDPSAVSYRLRFTRF